MSSLWHSRGMRLATTLLTVLMMVVIFLFSAETAEESDLMSGFFARILIRVFCPGFNELNEAEQQVVYDQYQTVIRKCAPWRPGWTIATMPNGPAGPRPGASCTWRRRRATLRRP